MGGDWKAWLHEDLPVEFQLEKVSGPKGLEVVGQPKARGVHHGNSLPVGERQHHFPDTCLPADISGARTGECAHGSRCTLMTAVFLHARAVLRDRRRSWLGIAVLSALAGGAVVALVAGARRTDTAYARFLRAQRAADAVTFLGKGGPVSEDQVRHLANVADSATAELPFSPRDSDLIPIVLTDPRLGTAVDRFKFLAGRAPRRDRADEVAVSFVLARQRHLHVGSALTIHVPAADNPARPLTVRVVGIEAAPWEFPPVTFTNLPVYFSPAFLKTPDRCRERAAWGVSRGDGGPPASRRQGRATLPGRPPAAGP